MHTTIYRDTDRDFDRETPRDRRGSNQHPHRKRKQRRLAVLVAGVVTAFALLAGATAPASAGGRSGPDELALPNGFHPEGIAIGQKSAVFTGSLFDGTIWKGNLRTGVGAPLVTPAEPRSAIGMDVDKRGRQLFVAGGLFGAAYVYDVDTGDTLATYQLTDQPVTLVNDVVLTKNAAYFTDSFRPVIYKLPIGNKGQLPDQSEVVEIPLTGDFEFVTPLPDFRVNGNGIVAMRSGKWLVMAHTDLGRLYRVNPETGETVEIDLGGQSVPSADGLVVDGRTVYVVQNFLNQIGVVRLNGDLTSGTVGEPIVSDAFSIPTTADQSGRNLYAVNARFDVAPPPLAGTPPSPDVEFNIVKVRKPRK